MGIFQKVIDRMRSSRSSTYGRFRQSSEVDRMFETCQILPDFSYYYSGPDAEPAAIMGIHNDYSLRSRLWKKVQLTQAQLKAWVDSMSHHVDHAPVVRGFFMLDQKGQKIGIFYSVDKTKIRIEKDNGIVVQPPDEAPVLEGV